MNNWGLWLRVSFSLITFFFPFVTHSAFQSVLFPVLQWTRQWGVVTWQCEAADLGGQKNSSNRTEHFNKWDSLFAFAFFPACFVCSLLNSQTWKFKRRRENLLWWPPASSSCLPFFLSLCISMPWKFREAIIPNGGVTDSSTKGKCLKFYLCNCAFENLLRNISHKTKYIFGWNETRKGQSSCEVKSE